MNRNRTRGTTAVEFAIVVATLMIVIFGVLDLSRIVYLRMTLEEGVRRAARLAAGAGQLRRRHPLVCRGRRPGRPSLGSQLPRVRARPRRRRFRPW